MFAERKYKGGVDPKSSKVQRSAAFGVGDSVLDSLTCEICSVGDIDMSCGETLYGLYSTVDATWVRWALEGDLELL